MEEFDEFGLSLPEILLPKDRNLGSWSVIACDQYTQDEGYWKRAEVAAGGKPSTLNLILPEVYLSRPDKAERIARIKKTMAAYLAGGVFDAPETEAVYVERTTAFGRVRHGLVIAVDLEDYEWKPGSRALIRATEATIPERIPPRKEIRTGAPLESPHIMLLVDDPSRLLVEGTGELVKSDATAKGGRTGGGVPLYDGDLMLASGHITGWAVKGEKALSHLHKALSALKEAGRSDDGSVFLFAVGDGNHSLATAKAVWDEYKAKSGLSGAEFENCPVRYALVEIVNIYDSGLTFEPIHRVVLGDEVNPDGLIANLEKALGGSHRDVADSAALEAAVKASKASFGFVYIGKDGRQHFTLLGTGITELAVSRLQPALDDYLSGKDGLELDYIHGADEVFRLGGEPGAVSIMLPPIAKDSFFATIAGRGSLPRKSFSMGEASEKRFYLECRRLFG
ncbi:MAG: DUF1015 domain-containing protein [Treponema sp.]|nr:DUF1015 domain-containing protein [Treponema sp.]